MKKQCLCSGWSNVVATRQSQHYLCCFSVKFNGNLQLKRNLKHKIAMRMIKPDTHKLNQDSTLKTGGCHQRLVCAGNFLVFICFFFTGIKLDLEIFGVFTTYKIVEKTLKIQSQILNSCTTALCNNSLIASKMSRVSRCKKKNPFAFLMSQNYEN